MLQKYISILLYLAAAGLTLVYLGNACAPQHDDASKDLSGLSESVCKGILKQEFDNGYRSFLRSNCSSCHVTGGDGYGVFADSHLDLAFQDFLILGFQKISNRAVSSDHKPPYTGEQNLAEVDELRANWESAQVEYQECLKNNSGGDDGGELPQEPEKPKIATIEKSLDVGSEYEPLEFDLETEMAEGQPTFSGAKFKIEIRNGEEGTQDPVTFYQFRNPELTAGDSALQISDLRISLDGELYEAGTTWKGVLRKVPAESSRIIGVGVMTFQVSEGEPKKMGLRIGELSVINFSPPTYQQLIAAGGVIGKNCSGCHGATNPRKGLNLLNYQSVVNDLIVTPFNPDGSLLWLRINDENSPMPPSNNKELMPEEDRKAIEDWILDGALNN